MNHYAQPLQKLCLHMIHCFGKIRKKHPEGAGKIQMSRTFAKKSCRQGLTAYSSNEICFFCSATTLTHQFSRHSHCANKVEFILRETDNGQARLPNQAHLCEAFFGFYRFKRYRARKCLLGTYIHTQPVWVVGGGVLVRFACNFCNTNDFFADIAVVIQRHIAKLHGAKIIAGLIVAHTAPAGVPFGNKGVPRIYVGFGFNEPILHKY
jgi:hypothetical protein